MNKHIKKYLDMSNGSNQSTNTKYKKMIVLRNLDKFLSIHKISSIKDFDDVRLREYIDYLHKTNNKNTSLVSYTLNLKSFFNYLLKVGVVTNNPFAVEKKDKNLSPDFKYYLNQFLSEHIRMNLPKSSFNSLKSCLINCFKYLIEHDVVSIDLIDREIVKSYIEHLVDSKKSDGTNRYKIVSVNRIISFLKTFFLYMENIGKCIGIISVLNNIKDLKSIHRNILSKKEISNLFNIQAKNLFEFGFKTFFVCQYATGLRITELLGLKIKDIDFKEKVILIYEGKTRRERFVHISEVALNYLRIYMDYVRHKLNRYSDRIEQVFVSINDGKILGSQTINKYLKEFCNQVGIKKEISSHCFRHSYGSHLLENGVDIVHVSQLLGHKDLSATERYTRLNPERLREIVNKYHPREQGGTEWN